MPPVPPPPFNQRWTDAKGMIPAGPVQDFLLAQQQAIDGHAAPVTARYLVATANPELTQEVDLGSLGSGFLVITTAIGVAAVSSAFPAATQATPADPTGTTNTGGKMMGLAGTITPVVTGTVLITITGTIFNATAIGDGAAVQMRTGTGGAPVNGAALAGTAVGGAVQYVAATTAQKAPFAVSAVVTGLTLGTARWIDVALAAITGGTATISDVSIAAVEV